MTEDIYTKIARLRSHRTMSHFATADDCKLHHQGYREALSDMAELASQESRLAAPSAASDAPGLPPAEHDKDMDRHYLPLPNGWEIQTKGKGSTFRICKVNGEDEYERWAVTDTHLHAPLQRMAEDCRAAISASQAAPKERLTDEQIKAIITDAVRAGKVSWIGYQADEGGKYTIPVLAPYHYQLARAILANSAPNAQLVEALQWIVDNPSAHKGNVDHVARAALKAAGVEGI